MKTKKILFGSTLLAAAAMSFCATPPALADDGASVDYGYTITAQSEKTPSGGTLNGYNGFEGIGIMVGGTVDGFVLQDASETAITSKNVYITGTSEDGTDSLTITKVNISASTTTSNWYGGLEAFIVENAKVILDGGVTGDNTKSSINTGNLDMTLCVGTMSDATLEITNGASITFNGVWNTLGSNLHTGTINISGEGSYLCTQQISIGMVYVSLSSGPSLKDGYYFAQYLESDKDRDAVVAAVTSGEYTGSYGIINVTDGGTYAVGVGNTNGSNNRLQLSNGEINIDGEGSSMILGGNSSIFMMGENGLYVTDEGDEDGETMHIATGVYYTEKIIVTNGGSVVNEENTSLRQAIFGDSFYAANTTVKVSVEGEGSTFDIAVGNDSTSNTYDYALFGSVYGYYKDFEGALNNGGDTYLGDGGSADVSISASDGGSFKVSAQEGIYAALDNAADYFDKQGDYKSAPPNGQEAGHSYGISVEFAATTGGSIELEATNGSDVVLAAGSAADGYENSVTVKADGTLTDEDGNVTAASSVSISGANIYANAHDAENVSVKITASDGGTITLTATGTDDDEDGVILLNQNTTITVDDKSTLNTTGTVTFNKGSSITVNDGGTWTSNGSVTVAYDASMSLNGTIDLSETIQNSGEVKVGKDVVFLLKEDDVNFKDENFNFTYTFITNTEADEATETKGGSIEGWDSLSTGNFAVFDVDNNEVTEGIGVITKADGQATVVFVTESETGTAITDYDFYIEAQSKTTTTGGTLSGYTQFTGIGTLINGTVDGFVLQDRTSITGETSAISDKNVYFAGVSEDGSDQLTITGINIATSTSKWYGGYEAFIVENAKVILDGGVTGDNTKSSINTGNLDLTLCVGTMSDATLEITNGASITFVGVWSTVGSNGATGTINISGSGSELNTQQISIGMSVFSLSGGASTKDGYYFAQYLESDADRNAVIQAILTGSASGEGYEGSYGIVNVTDGGTWTVGVGNTNSSNSRIQLANGEINVSGEGSQLLLGGASSLLMMGESSIVGVTWDESKQQYVYDNKVATGVMLTEKITVTDGGKVACADDAKLYQMTVGDSWVASNGEASISVSGSDDAGNASTFDLSFSASAWIGTNAGYWNAGLGAQTPDGGTQNVTISASDGGIFKISAAGGVVICADNYRDYIEKVESTAAGHSYGLKVALTAESGGSLTLSGGESGNIDIGAGSPAEGYTSSLTVSSTGTGSTLSISGKNITANYESSNLTSSYIATDGGSLELSATNQVVLGYGTSTNSKISVQAGTAGDEANDVKASSDTVSISGSVVYTNYLTPGLTTSFGAYEGGTLTISAEREIALGVGLDPQATSAEEATSGGSMSITADGAGSKVEISVAGTEGNQAIFINYETTGFESTITASNGGSISMSAGEVAIGYSQSKSGVSPSGSTTITATGKNSEITISATNDISTNIKSSKDLSVEITATDGGTINLIAGETADEPTPGSIKPFDDATDTTGTIYLGNNTAVNVDADSTLNTTGAVTFDAGSSLTLAKDGSWTSNGSVTVASDASMSLNGTIDLSNQIQNSGKVTVGEDVVFLLKEDDENFKDEDEHFNFTYDFIINSESGSIEGWDSLTIDNFSIIGVDNNDVPENLGIVTKADGQATVVFVTKDEQNGGTATVDYDYYIEYKRNNTFIGKFFYCIGITVDGTVDSFVLQDRTSITGDLKDITTAITGKDVLFIGSGATDADGKLVDSVTITDAKISNSASSTNAFAVEGTKVIIDGQASDNDGTSQIVIDELGMNIVVGTMYDAGDAELVITNGASVTTSAIYNTVGSNLNTGTITITGTGSLLANQQITLGGGVNSLFAAGAAVGQYQTRYFVDDDTYDNYIRDVLVSSDFDPTSGSYGIVNVTDGGTWKVGVGNTNSSNNRIQLANGEINIDGGSLIFGKNSSLLMMNESLFGTTVDSKTAAYTGMNISEKVTVKNGGTVSVEDNGTLSQLVIGDAFVASNVTAVVSVDGSDDSGTASSFTISANDAVYIGTNAGYWTNTGTQTSVYEGGTADVTVSATNGGKIDITSNGGFVICADNYRDYISKVEGTAIGHSYGLKVALTAESGGSLTLSGGESGNIDIGAGSPAEGHTSSLTVSSTGTNSTLSISGKNITANYESSSLTSSYIATDGGSLTLSATNQVVLGYGTSTNSKISVQAGTAEDKANDVEASSGTVSISGSVVYTNYLTPGLTTSFGAYEGGTLTISAEREIALGVGLDPQATSADEATSGGSMSITADGADSKVKISVAGTEGNQAIFINYETTEFTSTITASNGGSISMSAGEVAIGYSQSTSGVSPSGSTTITATGKNSEITISATNDISTNIKSSKDLSVEITATDGGTINLIAGETADEPTPGSIKPFDDATDTTGTIYLGNKTTVKVDAASTLNTTGAVTFDAGSSLTLAKDGSWTSNGSVTVASDASMSLNGRVDLSETIQNSGSVTVDSNVVFVLNDSLKVEGTSATYALIEGGTITNWNDSYLTTSNFVYSDSALDTNVVLDLTTDGYVTLLYTKDGVTINYDYEVPWQRGTHGLSGIEESGLDLYYFRAMHIEIDDPSVGGFTLSDANGEAITNKNVYITGSGKDSSKLTITDIKVSNTSAGYYAFVVENATVVINGTDVKVSELGMNLCIGTMDSAELQITSGAQVSTGGVWSTIGSNMATGTVTISGEGSSLTNAQINIGMATTSLSGGANEENGDGYYFGRFVQTESHYQGVLAALNSENYQPTDGSYGIVNVKEGGTWTISGSSTSNSRIQLSNGEINIDGEGSSLIFGKNSSLVMGNMTSSLTGADGNSVTLTVSETLNVTNGGTVKAADDVILYQFYVGQVRDASKGEATISVDGEGSSFKVSSQYVYIGLKNEATSGGTETVNISATNGGIFDITSTGSSLIVGYGYGDGASDKMDVHITADSGGSINLATTNGTVYFGYYAQTTSSSGDATNVTEVTAYANSTVSISSGADAETAGTIYFGYAAANGSDSVTADGGTVEIYARNLNVGWQTVDYSSTFTAKNGGTLNIETTNQVVLGYYYYKAASTDRTITVEATGSGSVVDIATGIFATNWDTTNDCTTNIKATDGGSIYIEASSDVYFGFTQSTHSGYYGYGTINISATGDKSLVDIYAKSSSSCIYFNGYEQNSLAVNISASDGGALIFSGTQVQFCANTAVTITSGGTLSTTATLFENTSSFSLDATSYWLSDGLATVEEGAELALNGRVEVTTAISNSGTITVSDSSLFVLSSNLQDKTDENTYTVIVTNQDSIETWHGLTAANFIFDDGSNLGRSVVDVSKDGVVTITEELESATLIWNGKESLHEWDTDKNDKDWKNGPQDDSFYTGDNVIFNEVAEDKDVLIHEQSLVAGTITVEVSEDADPETTIEYTFDFDNKASLEGESLSVGDGASLTVTGDGSLEIDGETDIAGDMTVTGGAKANFDDGVTIDETGSLTVKSDEDTGASGSVNVSGDLDVNGSLSVEDGSLTITETTDENTGETTGGTLDVSGEASITGGTVTADKVEVTEDGTLDFEGGTLNTGELTIHSDENTTLKGGDLNIGSLTVESGDSVTFGDGLTVGVYGDDGLTLGDELNINLDGSVGFDTSNGDITIEGTLSNNGETEGSLTKTGKGTLTLDGENTYSGGTTIDEGTIDAANTDALGTGEVDIHKGATLKIHSHDTSGDPDEFSNSTTGEGTLEIVEGDISLGDVGVQNVIVDKDATLDGDTTLTHSDASLDLAGTLEISVDEGEHITISTSGKVVIEYDAELDLESPSLGAGDSFVIVDGGTVTGDIDHFLGTDDTLLGLSSDYAVIYDTSNGLSVSIENTGTRSIPNMRLHDGLYSDFIAAVITEEDMTIVAGIQGTGDVSSNPIARELLNGNVSRAVEMLNTLAPNDYAAMIAMPTTAFHNDVSSIDKRLAAVRAMPFSEDENARWGYFAQADGTFADNDDANDTPTFDFQLYGILAGADYRMSNTLTVGVALGYDHEHAKLHNSGGRIDGDDVRVTVYAGAQLTDTVYANIGAQVGYGYYEARRHTVMGRASGETEGYNAGVFADVGMDLPLSEKHGISARPYVGLAYLRSFVRSFDDNLFDIGSFNNDSFRARVGLGVFWDLDGVSLGIDTSFSHDFCGEEIDDMSATYMATGSKFHMMAECLPEDVFSVGPVVSVGISEGLSAFAGYSFQAGSNEYIGHNVYIGVRANF